MPLRFPPPWYVEKQVTCFVVRDANGQALAYFYFDGPSTLAAIPAIGSIVETLTKTYHPYWLMLRKLGAAAIPAEPAIRHADDRNRFLRNGLIVSFNTTNFLLRS